MTEREPPVGPLDALRHPRYAGIRTFARLPTVESVARTDVAILGAPFDGGTSFRPGARFGPAAIREAALLLRPYNEPLDVSPFVVHRWIEAWSAYVVFASACASGPGRRGTNASGAGAKVVDESAWLAGDDPPPSVAASQPTATSARTARATRDRCMASGHPARPHARP